MGGSGLEEMFVKAGIFTSGVAKSLLGGKHVKRTREAYEVTVLWLKIMRDRGYNNYCDKQHGPHLNEEDWLKKLDEYPTINFWEKNVYEFLLNYFKLIRGQRSGDWPLTLSAIDDDLG